MNDPNFSCRKVGFLALLVSAVSACTTSPPEELRPVFRDDLAPDLVTEAAELVLPPSLGANRFVSGWFPWRDGSGRVVLAPTPQGARLEIAQLEARARTLVLDLHDGDPLPATPARAFAGSRPLGSFPWRDPLEIPLPADLPLGRVAIDLVAAEGDAVAPPGVVAAALRSARPEGVAKLERVAGAIPFDAVQSGPSRIDLATRIGERDEWLVGTFVPPAQPRAGERFEIALERADGSVIRRFSWSPSFWNRLRGARSFRLPLRGASGLVRVRLDAHGASTKETGGAASAATAAMREASEPPSSTLGGAISPGRARLANALRRPRRGFRQGLHRASWWSMCSTRYVPIVSALSVDRLALRV